MGETYCQALLGYAEHCAATGTTPTEAGWQEFLRDWQEAAAEDHTDAVETYWAEQSKYFAEGQ